MQAIAFLASNRQTWTGLGVALSIIVLWLLSLVGLLLIPVHSVVEGILAILGRTLLHTGLFVIAHDAMHGSLFPTYKGVNDRIGRLALGLYAALPYDQCRSNHKRHHHAPGQCSDPDFHDGIHRHPVQWYVKFIREYLSPGSLGLFLVGWGSIGIGLGQTVGVSWVNWVAFGVIPLILSSIQLFVFGSYLPHRHLHEWNRRRDRSPVNRCRILWSFLLCYHFGTYHWEHHAFPQIPWYGLPFVLKPKP